MGIPYLKTGAPWSLDVCRYKRGARDQIQLPFLFAAMSITFSDTGTQLLVFALSRTSGT